MKKARLILLAFTLLIAVLAVGCGEKDTPVPEATVNPTVPLVTAAPAVSPAPTKAPAATVSPVQPTPSPTSEATASDAG